jgi:hypothetical protein
LKEKQMQKQIYEHKQIGTLIILVFSTAILLLTVGAATGPSAPPLFLFGSVLAVLIISLILFCTLTVQVNNNKIVVFFGPGLIRKTFSVNEIRDTQIVKNRWYYGWGIRLLPKGWLYNVSGFDAVALTLKNDRKYRIGTDDPNGLLAAIQQVLKEN